MASSAAVTSEPIKRFAGVCVIIQLRSLAEPISNVRLGRFTENLIIVSSARDASSPR